MLFCQAVKAIHYEKNSNATNMNNVFISQYSKVCVCGGGKLRIFRFLLISPITELTSHPTLTGCISFSDKSVKLVLETLGFDLKLQWFCLSCTRNPTYQL